MKKKFFSSADFAHRAFSLFKIQFANEMNTIFLLLAIKIHETEFIANPLRWYCAQFINIMHI